MFIFYTFFYSTSYLSLYTTSYSCASFSISMWSYHQWFRYPFATLHVREWTHYNPWYALRYHCNYCVGKWNSHTKRGFSLFPCHTRKQVDIFITKNNFQTLTNFVIVNSTCIDLVQCALMTITHAMTVVTQNKTQSYTKQTPRDYFISLA
jgi:hypothetical protein